MRSAIRPIPPPPRPPAPKPPKRSRHEVVWEMVEAGIHQSTGFSGTVWRCPRCTFSRSYATVQGALTKATEHVIAKHPEVGA